MLIQGGMFKRGRTDSKADEAGLSRLFMIALRTGSAAAVRAFLSRKTELAATDDRGRSPLIIAAALGHLTICELLLEAGSDPFARDIEGLDASQHALQAGHEEVHVLLDLAKGIRPDEDGSCDPHLADSSLSPKEVAASGSANHPSTVGSLRPQEFPHPIVDDVRYSGFVDRIPASVQVTPRQDFEAFEPANSWQLLSDQVEPVTDGRQPHAPSPIGFTAQISGDDMPSPMKRYTSREAVTPVAQGNAIKANEYGSPEIEEVSFSEHRGRDAEIDVGRTSTPELPASVDRDAAPSTTSVDATEIERIRTSELTQVIAPASGTPADADCERGETETWADPRLHEDIAASTEHVCEKIAFAEVETDGNDDGGWAASRERGTAKSLPDGQLVSLATREDVARFRCAPAEPSSGAEPDAESWEVDTTQLPTDNDRSAVHAASLVQERLSSAIHVVGGEDWSFIEIDLPDVRLVRSERVLPNWVVATASGALSRAAAIGEFQDDQCDLPRRMLDSQEQNLRRAVRQTAASLGCVVDRAPDPWSDTLKTNAAGPVDRAEIEDAVDALATHFWSVGRPSSYDARLDAMPRLERATEADLFRQIVQSTAEAMLSIAKSAGAIDFIIAADDLVDEAILPFTFVSSHPLNEGVDGSEAFSESNDDDDAVEPGNAAAMIELPAPYVSAMIQLRAIRASRSAIMLPSEIRHAARALQELSLTTEFLGYLACELPAIDESKGTMDAVFRAMRHADQAKQMVLERHLPQTRAFAQRYLGRGLELDDLVQEGNIGLMRAIETFDTERGHRFWTYAQAWVWQRLNRAIADLGSAIRLPVHLLQDRRRLEAVMAEREKVGDRCDPQSLSESSDLPIRTVQRLLSAWTVSALEDDEDWAEDGVAGARLRDDRQADPLAKAVESDLAEELRIELEELPPRIAEVVRMRFGLEGRQEHTLEEIGQQYGVTRERIRQLEAKGLKILGHPARSRALRTFLEH